MNNKEMINNIERICGKNSIPYNNIRIYEDADNRFVKNMYIHILEREGKLKQTISDIIQEVPEDESDRITALQEFPVTTEEKIRTDAIMNYSVSVLAEVAERAKQEDAPIYEGDKEVDQWVRLSDVEEALNKYLN